MTTERMEVQRTIAADAGDDLPGAARPAGSRGDRQLRDADGRHRRAGDRGRRHLRRAHGSRGAERLPDGPVRRDRHDHDVRARPRDRVDDRRPDPARRSATSTATRSSRSTAARSSPRTTTGRRSTRTGRRPTSSRSSPRARCGPRSGSSPARSPARVAAHPPDVLYLVIAEVKTTPPPPTVESLRQGLATLERLAELMQAGTVLRGRRVRRTHGDELHGRRRIAQRAAPDRRVAADVHAGRMADDPAGEPQ